MTEGAGVHNPSVIDLITHDPARDEVALIMIDDRRWDGSAQRREELLAKANTYLTYAKEGEMLRQYPEYSSSRVRFQLDCSTPPDAQTRGFLDRIADKLGEHGIRFTICVR